MCSPKSQITRKFKIPLVEKYNNFIMKCLFEKNLIILFTFMPTIYKALPHFFFACLTCTTMSTTTTIIVHAHIKQLTHITLNDISHSNQHVTHLQQTRIQVQNITHITICKHQMFQNTKKNLHNKLVFLGVSNHQKKI